MHAQNLRVPTVCRTDEYLTVFGQYIIKPQLFDYLEEHIKNNVRERGEFQLTSALDRLRKEDGFLGLIDRRAALRHRPAGVLSGHAAHLQRGVEQAPPLNPLPMSWRGDLIGVCLPLSTMWGGGRGWG